MRPERVLEKADELAAQCAYTGAMLLDVYPEDPDDLGKAAARVRMLRAYCDSFLEAAEEDQ